MWVVLLVMASLDWSAFVSEPFDKQKPFIQDCINPEVQYVTACCGLQSGKSLVEADGLYAALYGPNPIMLPEGPRGKTPMEAWIISKSYSLAQSMLETFRWRTPQDIWLSDKETRAYGLTKDDRWTWYLRPRENCEDPAPIKLRMRTASDPDGMRATPTLGVAACDELARWKPKSFQNLQARAIVARTKFISGTTTNGKNFVYRELALPAGYGGAAHSELEKRIHTWTSADNPYADKRHIERLRRIFGREYAKQELEGLFTDSIGYVFGEFDRTTMMVDLPSDDPKDFDRITAGIDPGWTDAYAGCVWGRFRGDGCWYQLWELHEQQCTSVELAPRFVEAQNTWNVQKWQTDKRRPSDIALLRRNGVRSVPNLDIHAENDARTIPVMLAVCQGLMQQGKIKILKDHEFTAEEFENYHYPDPSDENPKNTNDNPVDWMNHHMDAMRYALCAVEDIVPAGPRYRQGSSQTPQELPRATGPKVLIPTLAESLAYQDEKFDRKEDLRMGGKRRLAPHFLRNRWRPKGEL